MKNKIEEIIIKMIVGEFNIHWGSKELVKKVVNKILQTVYKEIEQKLNEEYDKQKVPASYEIVHYKMGLEKSLELVKQIMDVEG